MKRISQYFLQGLIFLVPLAATLYVIYWVFVKIDRLLNLPVPGVGFIVTVVFITLIGFVASNFLTRNVVHLVDKIFARLPLVKMIYTAIKDLVNAFVGDKKSFNRPVEVVIDRESNLRVIGFATRDSLESIGIKDSMAVYLPQSYNFAGNLIIVDREQVTPMSADPGEVMKLIVSGGVSSK
ncbi:MAG: DUF502 domain-containing protein [Deltaproteobacteria bacterium]|jgi:uncharacterized membrane protein|nr:DUF502 domain-containing protein [Deltaproteobacteria bacterium]